jgi:hypothetical protein
MSASIVDSGKMRTRLERPPVGAFQTQEINFRFGYCRSIAVEGPSGPLSPHKTNTGSDTLRCHRLDVNLADLFPIVRNVALRIDSHHC